MYYFHIVYKKLFEWEGDVVEEGEEKEVRGGGGETLHPQK